MLGVLLTSSHLFLLGVVKGWWNHVLFLKLKLKHLWYEGCNPYSGRKNQFSLEGTETGDASWFWGDYQGLQVKTDKNHPVSQMPNQTETGDASSFWGDYQGLRKHKEFLLNLQTRHPNNLKVQKSISYDRSWLKYLSTLQSMHMLASQQPEGTEVY